MPKKSLTRIVYLIQFFRPYTTLIVATFIALVASRVTAALDPVWLKHIIDGVISHRSLADLWPVVGVYFGIKAATALFEYLRDIFFAPAEMGITKTLSERLFYHLLSLPMSYHVEQKIGGLSRRITRGGRAVTFLLDFFVINILPTIIGLIVTTFFLLRLYPVQYALITFVTVIFYAWFTLWSTEKRQKYRLGANLADDEVAGIEVDALTNIDTVKYFNNEVRLEARYAPAVLKRYTMALASNQLFALISGVQSIILLFGLGLILFLAVRQTVNGSMTIGDLVLLTTYIVQLSAPINTLGFIYRQIKDGLADLQGMADILQEEVNLKEPLYPVAIPKPQGKIEFKEVGFGYASRPNVLKDITFTVKPGQRVAFVGPSGVGKSTIVKLLFRIYDPTAGEIVIDDVNLLDLDKNTRRSLFAIVPQEPALFNATIGENIRFGKPDATDEEVHLAAKAAHIAHFIEGLPEKYETVVGERGIKLSGGEKQRVAIARAIIRDPKILVFDEATSSLDSHSEREIQTALDTVAQGRTTLAVAHRLSTIVHSDQIYVLRGGTIVEQGTHHQLLAKDGHYAKLWKLQAAGKDPELTPE
jgi:ABC-type transport system involved in Fe-S cluster assembly fused permease/ATPase subunit